MTAVLRPTGKRRIDQHGFTLIEMLIVVIVLGILAMIIVPQISITTEDAKVSTLQTSLAGVRSAVELYYVQHDNTYPGERTVSGGTASSDAESIVAFVQQLTRYTNASGSIATVKDTTFKYGPYIKTGSLPTNPFNDSSGVYADISVDSITESRTASGTQGWRAFPQTGVVFANDGGTSDGTAHSSY